MKRVNKEPKGFTLIIIILMMAMISILGLTIISTTRSTYNMAKIDSRSQSTYYIAEAGINQTINDINGKVNELSEEVLSHDEFFNLLDTYISKDLKLRLDNFEDNNGDKPSASITVDKDKKYEDEEIDNISKKTINYKIESLGEIGNSKREAVASIEIAHGIEKGDNSTRHPAFDYVIYSKNPLKLPNQTIIKGDLYTKDLQLETAGSQIDGNVISETFVNINGAGSIPRINGNVYALNGGVKVSTGGNAIVEGSVYAHGDTVIGSHGLVKKDVFTSGNLTMLAGQSKIMGNLHAHGNIGMESGASIGKNAYSNGNLTLKNSNSIVQGDAFIGKSIYRENNTFIQGNSRAGGSINQHTSANINMKINSGNTPIKPKFPIEAPVQPPELSDFSPNMSKNISVPQSSLDYTINPGSYGNLFIGGDNAVILKSGDYIFNSIDGARWKQSLKLDLRDGPINVYSKGDIKYTGPIYVLFDKKIGWIRIDELKVEEAISLAGMVYWETHGNFILNNDTSPRQWFGTVLADKNITVGDSVMLIGAYIANNGRINFGNSPKLIYSSSTKSSSVDSGSSNGNDKGQNNISTELRLKITSPIREK